MTVYVAFVRLRGTQPNHPSPTFSCAILATRLALRHAARTSSYFRCVSYFSTPARLTLRDRNWPVSARTLRSSNLRLSRSWCGELALARCFPPRFHIRHVLTLRLGPLTLCTHGPCLPPRPVTRHTLQRPLSARRTFQCSIIQR